MHTTMIQCYQVGSNWVIVQSPESIPPLEIKLDYIEENISRQDTRIPEFIVSLTDELTEKATDPHFVIQFPCTASLIRQLSGIDPLSLSSLGVLIGTYTAFLNQRNAAHNK